MSRFLYRYVARAGGPTYFLYVNIRMAGEANIYMSIHIFEIQNVVYMCFCFDDDDVYVSYMM